MSIKHRMSHRISVPIPFGKGLFEIFELGSL